MDESNTGARGKAGTERRVGRQGLAASAGAMGAAVLASLCCIGPVLFVTLGVGAGLASQFEPFRPVFTILTVALIAAGFYSIYGRRVGTAAASCDADEYCDVPRNHRRDRTFFWSATFIALVLLTFPWWSVLLV